MPYDSIISRSDASALIPQEVSNEILTGVWKLNPLMQLARRLPNMSAAQKRLPVMSALATAYFVSGDNSLKETTEINWANKYIDAEELAVIVPIPEAVLDDSSFDVWAQVRPELETALSIAISHAVFYGTNIPASWTTNLGAAGLLALCVADGHSLSLAAYTDLYEAVLGETGAGTDGVYMSIEADGFMVTGSVAHPSIKGKIRNSRDMLGQPIFKDNQLDGTPISFPTDGTMVAASALMFSGQWDQLIYAMRQDITYKILDQAVIQDATGKIIYNLAQQDMVAMRAVMRLGFALPNPLNRMTAAATRCAFAVLTA